MLKLLKKLHEDEHGVILSAEIVIVGSILVIGLITGLTCLQHSVNGELKDVAAAIGSLDQSYSFSGQVKPGWNGRCCAFTAGSSFANCESKCETEQSQITGCCNVVAVASVASCCGTCGGRGVAGGCGSCGGNCGSGNCGGCGQAGSVLPATPRCIDTGSSGVQASEWLIPAPLYPNVPPVPQMDPAFSSTDPCCPAATSSEPAYGDIVIPDHVW